MTPQPNILQQCRREADEIQWQRFDALLNPRLAKGSQKAFTDVILDYCKPKPVARPVQNNLHLNGGGLDALIQDAVDIAINGTRTQLEAAAKLRVTRGWLFSHLKKRKAVGV